MNRFIQRKNLLPYEGGSIKAAKALYFERGGEVTALPPLGENTEYGKVHYIINRIRDNPAANILMNT